MIEKLTLRVDLERDLRVTLIPLKGMRRNGFSFKGYDNKRNNN